MLLLLVSAGCAGSGDGQGPTAATVPTTSLGAAPTTSSPVTTAAATCTDSTGDGRPADIKSVALRRDNDQLILRFKLTAPPPRTGTVLYSVMASSMSGDRIRQLGVKYLNGRQIAYFVFDGEGQQNLPGSASRGGSLLTAAFPADAVTALGETWEWSGNTNVQGRDVDACPDTGADALNPKRARFPG
jgi:hypothetical protein